MATRREKPKADDDPERFLPNDNLTENPENDGKLITLELQCSKKAKKTEKNLKKSLKTWLQTQIKDLKFSDLKIQGDNNALIKVEHSSAAEILQKLSGKDLALKDGTTVTITNVILGSLKKNTQTADDASMTSTPPTSDDKGQMNGQSDKDSSPEQRSRDEKKKTKDGDGLDKHTQSSKSDTSNQTGQKDQVDQGVGTPLAIQEESKENVATKKKEPESDGNPAAEHLENPENDGKLIILELQWSKTAKKADKYLEESLKKCLQTKNKDLKFSDLKIQEDNNALIKIKHSSDAEILEKLSGEDLTLDKGTTVTVTNVILGSLKKNIQTADDASTTPTPSTSDDTGQMNGQRDEDSASGKRSRDTRKNPKDGDVPDKHTDKGQMNDQRDQDSRPEKSSLSKFELRHLSNNCTDQTRQKDKVDPRAATYRDFSKESQEKLVRERKKAKADDNPAGSPIIAEVSDNKKKDEARITLVLKWSNKPRKEKEYLQKSLQTWFSKTQKDLTCSVVNILENKNALIKFESSPALEILQKLSGVNMTLQDNTTVTVESIIMDSPKLNAQTADSMTPTPSTPDVSGQKRSQNDQDSAEGSSPEKQIRQNQEDAVSVPVGFFWYLSQVYKEEIKQIEKENGSEMEETVKVTFKAKEKDGSQKKALSEFTNLVQKTFNESRESVIPLQNVRPEQCSEAFKLIQNNENKVVLTLTPKEITVCGPDSAQLKSVLERNAPDDKLYLLRDVTPLKMTINDPLADAGMKMEESTWKALNAAADGKITKIKEKFDVDFQEVRRDGGKVQVKAFCKSPEGNPCMESNAVRALLRLYQRSVTSPLNFTQPQGASGFRDWQKMHEDESEKRSVPEGGATGGDSTEENCPICLSPFTDKKSLSCKHEFCKLCLQRAVESNGAICPICRKVFGIIQGDQPDGSMSFRKSSGDVPGFSNCGIITITYTIPSGTQTEKHPKPGHNYHGTTRTAYLPDNREGNEVLNLLKRAFDQKLIFTIGASRTTGCENQVTWNDIHHKTSLYGGPDSYGYPDPNYLSRVREELKAKGIE